MTNTRKTFSADEVEALDQRRQHQIKNQVATIDRLLEGDSTYDDEMRVLHEHLAAAQEERDSLQKRLDALEAELAHHNLGRS